MNSIYEETLRAVENGAGFKVDFRRRNLKIDGRYVIENGRYEGELGVPPSSEDEFFSNVEELYCRYKHSVPSERSEGKSRRYFRAMPEKDLDDDDMLYGERRDKAPWSYTFSVRYSTASNGIPRRWDAGSGKAGQTEIW